MASNQMASLPDVRLPCSNEGIGAAEYAILELLKKENKSEKDTKDLDTKDLWNYLESKELKSMSEEKGLIKLLEEKHITRMWEIAVGTDIDIAHFSAPDDEILNALGKKSDKTTTEKADYDAAVEKHAAAAFNAMLPQAGQHPVKFIVKRKKKGGWDTLYFTWERSSNGFTLKEDSERTISGSDNRNNSHVALNMEGTANQYYVEIIEDKPSLLSRFLDYLALGNGKNDPTDKPFSSLSVQRNPTSVPNSVEPCVAELTFGNGENDTNKIIVYIRFAGPTMLVGKAFKVNCADKSEDKILRGILVLAKHKSN